MPRIRLVALTTMLLSACATQLPPPEPVVVEEPVEVVVEPAPAPVVEEQAEPVPEPAPAAPPPLPSVAIVLTSNQPVYADVAKELTGHFENYDVYDLGDESRTPVSVLRLINDSSPVAVIAIGVRAAKSSVAMSRQPVVFSQVFNYRHHDLLKENTRGVAALPPLDAQLAAWREINPSVQRIGFIIGDGHEDLVAEAEIAAQRHGLDLTAEVSRSDQETLYIFRRMIRDIDGFLLLPDNRILSSRVLQEMMSEARRHRVPVSVPNDAMLSLGASLSMTASAADIARTIVKVVRAIQAGSIDDIPPVTGLSEILIKTGPVEQVAR
jgi:ABC-type uncharacterized transport system substrate-binding protein